MDILRRLRQVLWKNRPLASSRHQIELTIHLINDRIPLTDVGPLGLWFYFIMQTNDKQLLK